MFFTLIAFIPTPADAVWFSSSWNYKVKVEVNPTKVGSSTAVTNMPVYFDLAGMPASFWTNASNTGADIRVVESDDTTETAFELVSFSTSTMRGELHFLADGPLATSSASSTFYIYYGNAAAQAYAVTDTYGRNNVWNDNMAIYHMESNANDSTSNARNGISTSVTYASGGKVGGRGDFVPATNSGVSISSLDMPTLTNPKSFTMWLNVDTLKREWFFAGGTDSASAAFGFFIGGVPATDELFFFGNGGASDINYGTGKVTASTWTKMTITYDGTNVRWYKNGDLQNTTARTLATTNVSTGTLLGNRKTDEANSRYDGKMDEVRVKAGTWDASWITTEYNNQSSTSTFFYVGPQQVNTSASTESGAVWFD